MQGKKNKKVLPDQGNTRWGALWRRISAAESQMVLEIKEERKNSLLDIQADWSSGRLKGLYKDYMKLSLEIFYL